MSTAERTRPVPPPAHRLRTGDRMSAEDFHRLYRETPEDFRAELVGGVVYVASPLGLEHATNDGYLGALLVTYAGMTPGLQSGHGATLRLGSQGEPQPDLFLRILPEFGGQSSTEGKYIGGGPELVAEVAHTTQDLDLGAKYDDYRRYGVREYLVMDLRDKEFRWFDLTANQELARDADGVIRVRQFPGLWLSAAAILAGDFPAMRATLEAGMTTAEYRQFVKSLESRRP